MFRALFTKLMDRLFLRLAHRRNVVPVNRDALQRALKAAEANLTFLSRSGSLNDGTTPNAFKRHATRKITHNSAVTLQSLALGVWLPRDLDLK